MPCGTVARNALSDAEYGQANEIAQELGGHFEGQVVDNTPGIDGFYEGMPASLKSVQPGSKNSIKALANAVNTANRKALNAEKHGVYCFVSAPGMTVAEIKQSARIPEILNDGQAALSKVSVRGSDGWVHFP